MKSQLVADCAEEEVVVAFEVVLKGLKERRMRAELEWIAKP